MRKSTVIATCLVNSKMFRSVEAADRAVQDIFADEFPDLDFNEWNAEMNDHDSEHVIRAVGKASRINVARFIEDLS